MGYRFKPLRCPFCYRIIGGCHNLDNCPAKLGRITNYKPKIRYGRYTRENKR